MTRRDFASALYADHQIDCTCDICAFERAEYHYYRNHASMRPTVKTVEPLILPIAQDLDFDTIPF